MANALSADQELCRRVAIENGHSIAQADNCDILYGYMACDGCPFYNDVMYIRNNASPSATKPERYKATISIHGGMIVLRCRLEFNWAVNTIPGIRWSHALQAWICAATSDNLGAIMEAIPEVEAIQSDKKKKGV